MKKPTVTHILFDWDGCLVHTLPLWLASYQYAFSRCSRQVHEAEIIAKGIYNFEAVTDGMVKDTEQFGSLMYEHYISHIGTITFHHEAVALLKKLRAKKVTTAIVTSTTRSTFEKQCTHLQCRDLFDATITWDDTEKHKPDPQPVLTAMKLIGAKKNSTLMIGDAHTDLLAAQHAGITAVWFDCPLNRPFLNKTHYAQIKNYHTISQLDELLQFI